MELHRMLGILRKRDEGAELAPSPSLRASTSWSRRCARPGLDATLTVEGEPADLPQGLDMSAYRIVQEALTNAMRYAPGVNGRRDGHLRPRPPARDPRRRRADAQRPRPARAPATGSSACASARRCSAASSRPGRTATASSCMRGCRYEGGGRRRSGAGARRPEDGARGRGRHRGRRRGRRRRGGARGRPPHAARRRADGHPDAGARRARGVAAAAGPRRPAEGARAHHVRRGGVPLRGAARGHQRLPPEGLPARAADRRRPHGRRRQRADRPGRDAPRDRGLRAPRRGSTRPRASSRSSPRASSRC